MLPLTLVALGVLLLLVGGGVGMSHLAEPEAPVASMAATPTSGGLVADLVVEVRAFGLEVTRSLRADPPGARGAPVPGLSVDRELEVGQGLPASARVELDLAAGSHADRADGAVATGSSASAPAPVRTPPAEAAALAAAAFAGAGAVAYFWSSLKTWGWRLLVAPLVPLYAHITRSEVFDNGVRERIFTAIGEEPGIAASELARRAGVSWGTTMYHLDVLEQTRMVVSLRDGRYRRYFQNGGVLAQAKEVVALLRNPSTCRVVDAVRAAPGVSQKELAERLGMTPQALHWHLVRLVRAGIVEKRRAGRLVRHYALG